MVVKKVTYVDLNGNNQTETCMFNLTKAELVDMDIEYGQRWSTDGLKGAIDMARDSASNGDGHMIVAIFKDLIARSYGEKSADGKRFVKSKEKTADFMSSEVYSAFFMEIVENPESAAAFVQGIVSTPTAAPALNVIQ